VKLPKEVFIKAHAKDGNNEAWLEASTDKFSLLEEDGEIIGTYKLEKTEKGKQLAEFKPVRQ